MFTSATNIKAVESTNITPTIVSDNPSTEEIQKIRAVVQQKVKEKLQQITASTAPDTTTPKSVFGTVIQIDQNQIAIDYKNSTKTINVDDSTTFIDEKKRKIKLDSIKVGQDILGLGYYSSDNAFTTKRLIISNLKSIENPNEVVVGKIVDISKSSPVFVLIPTKNKNSQYQIKTDSKTEVIDENNQKVNIKNLTSGQRIIVILRPDKQLSKTFYAVKIITDAAPSVTPSPTSAKTR